MRRLIVMTLLGASLLAACGSSTASKPSGGSQNPQARFPVTVTAGNGRVTVPARPTRIMSLSATATQMLYAMGAGPQVVAVDKYSTDPRKAPRTALTGFETDPESYVPFHPDLVIIAQTQGTLASQLAGLHITTLVLPPAATIGDTYDQFTQLGLATGHATAAAAAASSLRSKLDGIVRSIGKRDKGLTYYHEVDPTLYTATSHTFIGALYSRLGMVNIADAAGRGGNDYPQLSAEYLLQANPDYVFLADVVCCGQTATSFAKRPGYSILRAVKLRHVFTIPDPIASEWGPRVVDFLQMVARDVHSS